jgi:hypothetical protein
MGEKRNAYRIFVGKPEGKRQRCRWMNNIKMVLREIGWGDKDWIYPARIENSEGSCEHGNEPSGSIKFWKVIE